MPRISRYVLLQVLGPLAFFTAVLTMVVWLSQSLRMLDLVINQGQSAGVFAYLTLLALPGLMTLILPAALLCATLYALYRLHGDSELVVIWAAGLSRWRVVMPLLAVGALVTVINLVINAYLMPLGNRTMKDRVFEIRSDLVSTFLREGQFTTPANGLTVYIRERTGGGEISGILVHDNRDTALPVTYMAARGRLVSSEEGPRLVMEQGDIQRVEGPGRLSVLAFDKYVFDLNVFASPQRLGARETSERYLDELFDPTYVNDRDRQRGGLYAAEGHNRLATPLYNIVFVLASAAFLLTGSFARRGIGWRVLAAVGVSLAARLAGFGLQSAIAGQPALGFLAYLFPLAVIAYLAAALNDWVPVWFERRSRAVDPGEIPGEPA